MAKRTRIVVPEKANLGRRIRAVVRRLEKAYGPRPWRRHGPAVDGLVQTILSQSTNDGNSGRAFRNLKKRFGTWEAVRQARVSAIVSAIRSGGLAQQKAARIKKFLNTLHEQRGSLSLEFLRKLPLAEAKRHLSAYEGVGPKTAACVWMFHFNRPALPGDTPVHRVSKRLGLTGTQTPAPRAPAGLGPAGRLTAPSSYARAASSAARSGTIRRLPPPLRSRSNRRRPM